MENLVSRIRNFLKKEVVKDKIEEIPEPTFKVVEPTDEELQEMAKNNTKLMKLSMWMEENFDDIFEVAPKNADYAVGVFEMVNGREIPTIHYFANKYTKKSIFNIFRATNPEGTLDFMIKHQEKGNMISHLIYRHQCEVKFLFYAA